MPQFRPRDRAHFTKEEKMINPQLRLANGRPLRFCSVEVSPEGKYMTDATGRVWIQNRSGSVQAKVWAETPAGRVVNGEKFNMAYTQDVTLTGSGQATVPDENNAFTLSQILFEFLEDFRKRYPCWATQSFGEDNGVRIEISWPDRILQPLFKPLPFVEPTSGTGYPLIHFPDNGNYSFPHPDILRHEYAHALHFSLVPHSVRDAYKIDYLGWMITNVFDPYHDFQKVTSETVAWVEAWASFSAGEGSPLYRSPKDGEKIEGAICNLVLRHFPNLVAAGNMPEIEKTFILSHARNLKEYAAWLAKSNPGHYQTFKKLAAAEYHISLP